MMHRALRLLVTLALGLLVAPQAAAAQPPVARIGMLTAGGGMSRGPGRWQRAILERLQTREQFYLTEILPYHTEERPDPSARAWMKKRVEHSVFYRHEQMAALRAAHRLAAQGQITLDTWRVWTNRLHWTGDRWQRLRGTIVARPGVRINRTTLQIACEVASRLEGSWPLSPERGQTPTKVPTLKPFQLGAVASGVKRLTQEGRPVDALAIEEITGRSLPRSIIEAALDQLKTSGDYQRIIDEASS
jgi:hypothetical protein